MPRPERLSKRLGLVVGLGPAAGMYYYRRLVRLCELREQPLEVVMAHAALPTVLEFARRGDLEALAEYLGSFMLRLAGAGCTIGAISAVTPHASFAEIQRRSSLPIVDLCLSVRQALERRNVRRVGLLGTKSVVESRLFGSLAAFDVSVPQEAELDRLDAAYAALALRGHGTAKDRRFFSTLAQHLIQRHRLDVVVLAATDLSALYEVTPPPFPFLDAADAHIEAIVARLAEP